MTAKNFKKGEKLRVNAVSDTTGDGLSLLWDPAGRTVGTTTADSFLSLPVELPI